MKYLIDYLVEAVKFPDLREYNTKKLRLDELIEFHIDEWIFVKYDNIYTICNN